LSARQVAGPASQSAPLIELKQLPRHVAIIMDGNGRWAQERGLSRQAGHRAGTENIRRAIETFARYRVPVLTLFAFSTENWVRPKREVNALIRLISHFIDRELQTLHENGVRLRHIGHLDPLSPQLQRRVEHAVEQTKDNDRITVNVAFNYGGRQEILDAVRQIVRDGVPAGRIDEERFASYLDTAGLPEVDLVIRTAGELRLSNFLLWQTAYAEYYFTPVYWPDFGVEEIERALTAYSRRERRFGGVEENGARRNHRRGGAKR
jgi:undecaprenyl diphosphate synthase